MNTQRRILSSIEPLCAFRDGVVQLVDHCFLVDFFHVVPDAKPQDCEQDVDRVLALGGEKVLRIILEEFFLNQSLIRHLLQASR